MSVKLSPGDVVHIWRDDLVGRGESFKYMVCICPVQRWFFYINSLPYRKVPEANVEIRHYEFTRLPNDISYLDSRKVTVLSYDALTNGMARRGAANLGPLTPAVRVRIKNAIRKHGILPSRQEAFVIKNL